MDIHLVSIGASGAHPGGNENRTGAGEARLWAFDASRVSLLHSDPPWYFGEHEQNVFMGKDQIHPKYYIRKVKSKLQNYKKIGLVTLALYGRVACLC